MIELKPLTSSDREQFIKDNQEAFLTEAALVGRLAMDQQGRWPSDSKEMLPSKIGECIWWLAVLSERMGLDFSECVEQFLKEKLDDLK